MHGLSLALAWLVSAGHESVLSSAYSVDREDPVIQSLAGLLLARSGGRIPPLRIASARVAAAPQMNDSSTAKVKIRVPSESTSKTGESKPIIIDTPTESNVKVAVKVRKPSEKSESPDDTKNLAVDAQDDSIQVKIKVKKPVQEDAPRDPFEGLSEGERKLVEGSRGNNTLLLEALKEGVNPNLIDSDGRSLLHYLAGAGNAPAMVLLIHFGAQVDIIDKAGLTPMHMAAGYVKPRSLSVLVKAGADASIESPSQGTPLNIVRLLGDAQLNQWLNRKGAEKITKKKDDRLEGLKACLEVFDRSEDIKDELEWDVMVKEVLQVITGIKKRDK